MVDTVQKKHFVLVHGFGQGGWCWYKLVTLLKSNGHKVTAVDLVGCGVNPKQLHEVSSIHEYMQPLMDFMAALLDEEKVILVGHSYGGFSISLAMESFPEKIPFAVFVTAYMPNCRDPPAFLLEEFFKRCKMETFMDSKFVFDEGTENLPTSAIFGPDCIANTVYRHCPKEDVELAKMLTRPNSFFLKDLSKKSLISEENYGKIRRFYVICEGDVVMEEEFQRYNIENSPPDDVISIAGAGHMAMISKTQELSSCLQELAQKCT